jgi:hypothetical protein
LKTKMGTESSSRERLGAMGQLHRRAHPSSVAKCSECDLASSLSPPRRYSKVVVVSGGEVGR